MAEVPVPVTSNGAGHRPQEPNHRTRGASGDQDDRYGSNDDGEDYPERRIAEITPEQGCQYGSAHQPRELEGGKLGFDAPSHREFTLGAQAESLHPAVERLPRNSQPLRG